MSEVIRDPEGRPVPWRHAAARSRGAFRSPPQIGDLRAHEEGLVSQREADLRDAIRLLIREAVEAGLSGGRARTAGMVAVAVESMALQQERYNARFAARQERR